MTIGPTSIDVSAAPAQVTITAHLSDDKRVASADVGLRNVDQPDDIAFAPLVRTSGTARDGVWSATLTVPKGAPPAGYWARVAVRDGSNQFARWWQDAHVTVTEAPTAPQPAPGPLERPASPVEPLVVGPAAVGVKRAQSLASVMRRGLAIVAECPQACRISARLSAGRVIIGRGSAVLSHAGSAGVRVRMSRTGRARLARRRGVTAVLTATITGRGGQKRDIVRPVTLR